MDSWDFETQSNTSKLVTFNPLGTTTTYHIVRFIENQDGILDRNTDRSSRERVNEIVVRHKNNLSIGQDAST